MSTYTHHRLMNMYQLRNTLQALLSIHHTYDLVSATFSHTEKNRVVEDWAEQARESVEAEINALVTEAYNRCGLDKDDEFERDMILASTVNLQTGQPFKVIITTSNQTSAR